MTTTLIEPEIDDGYAPIVLALQPVLSMTEDQFFEFCQINQDARLERNANQELIVMSPAGGSSSGRNVEIVRQIANWAIEDKTGRVFDSSCGYRLPNGAVRSPDTSWVSLKQLNMLTAHEIDRFLPLSPEFVIELRSPSDRISDLKIKMEEYILNGVKLGLLIIPEQKLVLIYRQGQRVLEIADGMKICCDPPLSGMELDMSRIW